MHTEESDATKQHRGLRPLRFRLSTLLACISILCLLLALMKLASPLLAAVVCLLLLAIFAHVAGNSIGMQLRSNGDLDLRGQEREETPYDPPKPTFAPPTSLRTHTRLGLTTIIPTAIFAIAGGVGGGWGLIHFSDNATILNVGLGSISAGVLGGLFGFWLSSLANIMLEAIVQAHRES